MKLATTRRSLIAGAPVCALAAAIPGTLKAVPPDNAASKQVKADTTIEDIGPSTELAASRVSWLGSWTGAVARTIADYFEDDLSVMHFIPPAERVRIRLRTSTADMAAYFQAAISAATAKGGARIRVPSGLYKTNRVMLDSNIHLLHEAGAEIRNYDTTTSSIYRIAGKDNVTIEGQAGSHINAVGHLSSTIYIEGGTNIEVKGLKINGRSDSGSGDGNDCIYVGGDAGAPAENVRIRNNVLYDGGRNCVSVVECYGCLIENNEIHGAGQVRNPGAGIDVEANGYDTVRRVTIRKNHIHTNLKYGVTVIFGDDVLIEDNDIHDNAIQGILTGAGGTQFNSGVLRSNVDMLAITGYIIDTGQIAITGGAELGVGAQITLNVRNSGTLAGGLSSGRYVVYDKTADNLHMRVALNHSPQTPITSFSDSGTGTLTRGSDTSDHYIKVFAEAQSSNITIRGNRLVGNCTDASAQVDEIQIGTSVNVTMEGNTIVPSVDNVGIKVTNSRGIRIAANRITGSKSSTSLSSKAITCTGNTHLELVGNYISDFITAGGVVVSGVYGQFVAERNVLYNTGSSSQHPFEISYIDGPIVRDLLMHNDAAYTTTYGLRAFAGISNAIIDGVTAMGMGSANADSISIGGSGNTVTNSRMNDGTLYATGSKPHDFASIPASAVGTSTTVTCTGAALGDAVQATMDSYIANLELLAVVSAANTVTVWPRNLSSIGGTAPASGTLSVRVVR